MLGATLTLSRSAFIAAFGSADEQGKLKAAAMAGRCNCMVVFMNTDPVFARFDRRQPRSDVVSSSRDAGMSS